MAEAPEIRTRRLILLRTGATQPSDERDGRSKGCIPVAQSFHVKMGALQERLQLSPRITAIRIHGAVMCSFQEFERGHVQNQPAAGTKHAVSFMHGE